MVKVIWKPLEKNHPIFTKGFSTYTPRTSRQIQGATRKIPKWLLGRETLHSPRERRINDIKKSISQRMEKNGAVKLNLDNFIRTSMAAEAVVHSWTC